MEPILIALAALGIVVGLVFVGLRVSLYLFSLSLDGTYRFARRIPANEERLLADYDKFVERPLYMGMLDTGHSSARYALGALMVIGLFLLLTILAVIYILPGML